MQKAVRDEIPGGCGLGLIISLAAFGNFIIFRWNGFPRNIRGNYQCYAERYQQAK